MDFYGTYESLWHRTGYKPTSLINQHERIALGTPPTDDTDGAVGGVRSMMLRG